jgi:hypothetical protein
MLLCDWAEEINGKLYIQGGGWSRVLLTQPLNLSVAIKIFVPWEQANQKHTIATFLVDDDGEPFTPEGQERPAEIRGEMEVGRPPGIRRGTDIDASLVARFQNLDLPSGQYAVIMEIDGSEVERVSFDVRRQEEVR